MYHLNTASKTPLYLQIVDQTKAAVARGYFQEGDQLPSVRDLAKTLLVNESTVSRAFKEMEAQGLIKTVVGKGTYLNFDPSKLDGIKGQMRRDLVAIFREAIFLRVSLEDIVALYEEVAREMKEEDHGHGD
ncbi:MAG: GntR family transcriptional regulator [Tissierellia bacterium]|nr:GntR family transcriptional regulator [Tissierellia bacterium]